MSYLLNYKVPMVVGTLLLSSCGSQIHNKSALNATEWARLKSLTCVVKNDNGSQAKWIIKAGKRLTPGGSFAGAFDAQIELQNAQGQKSTKMVHLEQIRMRKAGYAAQDGSVKIYPDELSDDDHTVIAVDSPIQELQVEWYRPLVCDGRFFDL